MPEKLSVKDLDLKGFKALIRVDFNVPIEKGEVADDSRIRASIPTIQYVLDHGGSVILISHLGRPKGKPDPQLSLTPCGKRLRELLKRPVQMAPDCQGPVVVEMARKLKPGEILLLENLRFHPGEENPEKAPSFVGDLAKLGDVYVNDAFGTAHRVHASTTVIAQFFPGKAAAGFLMLKEIAYLGSTLLNPKTPFCAILGGSKISTKFKAIEALMKKADILLLGGAMAFTFFKAENIQIGDSLFESDFMGVAREIIDSATQCRCRILLPVDVVIAVQLNCESERRVVKIKEGIPDGFKGLDIGPDTIKIYLKEIQKAATVFWNGPMGVFECPPFDEGTKALAKAIAEHPSATTIAGGGDTIAAVELAGVSDHFNHISTGGGAALEYIEFGHLPGIDALSNK